MKDIYTRISHLSKSQASFALFFTLLLYFLSMALVLPVVILITAWLWEGDMTSVQALLSGDLEAFAGGGYIFRLLQTENQLLTWGLVAVIMAMLLGNPQEVLRIKESPKMHNVYMPVFILIFLLPVVQAVYIPAESFSLPDFLSGWEASMRAREAQSQEVLLSLFSDKSLAVLFLNLFVFAVVPAFCEEFLFRGIIQQQFSRIMNPHTAIILSAAIFSFIHFQFYGFFGRMLLGAILGYFLFLSGSLWPSIIAHFSFNALSIILSYLASAYGIIDPEITQDSYQFSPVLLIFSILSVGILMFLYLRRLKTPSSLLHE